MIKLDYKNDKPLHEQITQGIKDLIMCGAMAADEQLPSVRDLSVSLTVNPNTVQRAYKTLETEGVIYSIRGKGNFVARMPEADKKTIDSLYQTLFETMRELLFYGEDKASIEKVLKKAIEEREDAV
jgi:GntR family transcriptional regulator